MSSIVLFFIIMFLIPIVPNIGALPFASFCNSDITALAKDRAYAQIQLNELSIQEVIAK